MRKFRLRLQHIPMIPAKAGIQLQPRDWVPAFAGKVGEGGE